MGKMKELAYTVERIELLFRYLELLNEANKSFGITNYIIVEKMGNVCSEIEKELGLY